MKIKKHLILFGTLFLGSGFVGATWALGGFRERSTDRLTSDAAYFPRVGQTQEALPPRSLRCEFVDETRMGFQLKSYTMQRSSDKPEIQQWTGSLYLRVLGTRQTGADEYATVLAAEINQQSPQTKSDRNMKSIAALRDPILLRMDSSCRITHVASKSVAEVSTRNQWRTLLKTIEYAIPEPGSARRWTTTQTDGIGNHWATYQRSDREDGVVEIQRSRGGYEKLHENMNGRVSASRVKSRSTIYRSSASPWIDHARIQEHVILKLDGKALADTETTLDLDALDVSSSDDTFFTRDFDEQEYVFQVADVLEQDDSVLPFARRPPIVGLAARSLSDVMQDIEKRLGQQPVDHDGSLNLIVQYLRLGSERPRALLEQLQRGAGSDSARALLFLGIGLTGGTEAHDALRTAANDKRFSTQDRLRALSALADVPDPDARVVDTLFAMSTERSGEGSGDVATTARLGLGILAKNPQIDQGSKTRILDSIEKDLQPGRDQQALHVALAAAGNSTDASLQENVRTWIDDPDPTVQAEAFDALQKMHALPAPAQLLKTLERTKNPEVLSVVTQGLAAASLSEIEIAHCSELLMTQPPEGLRGALIQILGSAAGEHTVAKVALIRQYHAETNATLLILLGRYLLPSDLI